MRGMIATDAGWEVEREFSASDAVIGLVRDLVGRQVRGWALSDDLRDRIVQVASELATNAVQVSRAGARIRVRLTLGGSDVVLGIWDGSPLRPMASMPVTTLEEIDALPDTAGPDELPEFGSWGLPLVGTLATKAGIDWVEPIPAAGKWMWATFDYER